MTTQLLEIKPQELKFTFELRKPSSCSILLSNNSDHCLAFKIKTTSPKKYSVRPNVGVIKPNSTCDFTVTMQAQQVGPNMQCKDKFLIQSTIVLYGTTDNNITSDTFAKDRGNYVEEKKVRVVLVRPLQTPVLLPINEDCNQDPQLEASSAPKDSKAHCGVENIPPTQLLGVEGSEVVKETAQKKDVDFRHPRQDVKQDPASELEDLKSNIVLMESKLKEAELTIEKLTEERKHTSIEKDQLCNDVQVLEKNDARKVQAGFPFLFVCMVALISLTVGYLARS